MPKPRTVANPVDADTLEGWRRVRRSWGGRGYLDFEEHAEKKRKREKCDPACFFCEADRHPELYGLKARIAVLLSEAEHEDIEIGMTSTLSRRISRLIAEYGTIAVEALRDSLETRRPGDEVMGIVLRQLGRAREKNSHPLRRDLLISLLRSRSVQTRHAAATGLAGLDDPAAIPALQLALEKEPHERPREHLELVLKQLRDTQQK